MEDPKAEAFIELLVPNQKRLFTFILSLVTNHADAEDITQEVSKVLWRKFEEFESGSDFMAWAKRIAYLEVLNYRKQQGKKRQRLSKEAVRLLEKESSAPINDLDAHMDAMRQCMKKLKAHDLELIKLRFHEEMTVRAMGQRFGQTVQAIYKNLGRVQEVLMRCVNRALHEQGLV